MGIFGFENIPSGNPAENGKDLFGNRKSIGPTNFPNPQELLFVGNDDLNLHI
jgi:hypothetical protein